ncbi:MAG: hypothetical protein NTU48_10035 [Legionellales bacterium]|nr:hypothetical protein [Legionellales bacterium]
MKVQKINKKISTKKRTETIEKFLTAMQTMELESILINFNSPSNFTEVTKAWQIMRTN